MSERFAVHQVPRVMSITDTFGMDAFGIQYQWQYLKMEEKALSGVTRANGGSVLPLSRAEVVVQLNGFHSAEAAVVVELIE